MKSLKLHEAAELLRELKSLVDSLPASGRSAVVGGLRDAIRECEAAEVASPCGCMRSFRTATAIA